MQEIQQFISTVGFPIFVAVYMMTKGTKQSDALVTAVNELKSAVQKITENCTNCGENNKKGAA